MIECAASVETKLPTFGGWQFTPEGAAVHAAERTAVIADIHLGYEWARGAAAIVFLPIHLRETLARLSTLLDRSGVSRLIVAGDLLESARPCPRTAHDLECLKSWLADRDVDYASSGGNHDVSFSSSARRAHSARTGLPRTCVVAGWTIGHGHRPIDRARSGSPGIIIPYFAGRESRPRVSWWGRVESCCRRFQRDAAGCNVISAALPKEWLAGSLHCLVSTGNEVLDFGPLANLRAG